MRGEFGPGEACLEVSIQVQMTNDAMLQVWLSLSAGDFRLGTLGHGWWGAPLSRVEVLFGAEFSHDPSFETQSSNISADLALQRR